MKRISTRYQAMVEFLIMTFVCIFIVYSLVYVMQYFSQHTWRILALVAIDYP